MTAALSSIPRAASSSPRVVGATRGHVGALPGLFEEISIDLFAGGGGMSMAWEIATGRCVDEAVNHDADAIWMHLHNHPNTRHHREDVWGVDPFDVAQGRPVGWLHASPDCTHFSMARGGKPVKKEIRGLAWVVLRWAAKLSPRLITMENVREFLTWGPLNRNRRPVKSRRGETFEHWRRQLTELGYVVDWKVLDAADFGAPTHRRRLFIVARRDGRPIGWPERTHGQEVAHQGAGGTSPNGDRGRRLAVDQLRIDGRGEKAGLHFPRFDAENDRRQLEDRARTSSSRRSRAERGLKPFRTAAECIDWSITCPSIFARKKALADNTLRRIARGLVKFVLSSARPYLVHVDHGGPDFRGQPLDRPLPTVCADHGFALVTPYFVDRYGERLGQDPRARRIDVPMGTITQTANAANLISPYLCRHRFGDVGWKSLGEPLQTICAQGNHFALIAPHLIQYNGAKGGEARGLRLDVPINTLPTENRFALVAPYLAQTGNTGGNGDYIRSLLNPLGTIVSKQFDLLITPYLVGAGGRSPDPRGIVRPLGTILPKDAPSLVTPFLYKNVIGLEPGQPLDRPLHTITTVHNKFQLVAPLAVKFFRTGICKPIDRPIDAITGRDRFGIVAASLLANTTNNLGCHPLQPLGTVTTANRHFLLSAFLAKHYGGPRNLNISGQALDDPIGTITSVDHHSLCSVFLAKHYGGDRGNCAGRTIGVDGPLGTITASDHHSLVAAWGTKLYGTCAHGFDLFDAVPTITAGSNHLYLSSASLHGAGAGDGPTDDPAINVGFWRVHELLVRFLGPDAPLPIVHAEGQQFLIHDIGMRMLSPRELLSAQFSPELAKDYVLTGTRESQVAKIGNSVPPYLGAAVIRANWDEADGCDSDGEVAA